MAATWKNAELLTAARAVGSRSGTAVGQPRRPCHSEFLAGESRVDETSGISPTAPSVCGVAGQLHTLFGMNVSLNRFMAIVDSSSDAILTRTLEGTIASWNRAATRIFGYEPPEAIGQPITILLPSDRLAEAEDLQSRVLGGVLVERFATCRVRKDGTSIEVLITSSPVRNSDGRIVEVAEIVRAVAQRGEREVKVMTATTLTVGDVMTREVVTVSPESSIHDAALLMVEHRVSGLPVVSHDRRLLGVISDGDLIVRQRRVAATPWWRQFFADGERLAREYRRAVGTTVAEVMSPAVSINPAFLVETAAAILLNRGFRRLPVVRDGKVVGIVSRSDLLRALTAEDRHDREAR